MKAAAMKTANVNAKPTTVATAAKKVAAGNDRAGVNNTGAKDSAPELHGIEDPVLADMIARMNCAQDDLLEYLGTISWKRALCAFVTSVTVGAGIGWITGKLIGFMALGAVVAGAPAFIAIAIWVLGLVLALYFGSKVAARIAGAVLTGEADERAAAAYRATKHYAAKLNPLNWFGGAKAGTELVPA